jgi:hypothetical protein
MDQIRYAGNTLETGTDIAHAVLAYAQALAANGDSATITIPVRHNDGSVVKAEVLIGPASQLISEPSDTSDSELEDAHTVRWLTEATAKLRTPHPTAEAAADYWAVDDNDLDQTPSTPDNWAEDAIGSTMSPPHTVTNDPPTSARGRVARYFRAWNDGDRSEIGDLIGSEWMDHAHPERRSAEDVAAAIEAERATHPDMRVFVDAMFENNQLITVNGRVVSDGESHNRRWFVRIEDEHMCEMWTYSGDWRAAIPGEEH